MLQQITIAHSADADDAFMFYALSANKISSHAIVINHHITEIEQLNNDAHHERYEITAISFYAFSKVNDKYELMPCGASFGYNYGPIVVAKQPLGVDQLKSTLIAVPGTSTSSFHLLSYYLGNFPFEVVPFDAILPQVAEGNYQAGLIIHEGQITYTQHNLLNVFDIGKLWFEDTKLPLPLGGLAIKKNIAYQDKKLLVSLIKESLSFSFNNFDEAFNYATKYSRNAPETTVRQFIKMYVNDLTVDYGETGKLALRTFSEKLQIPDLSQSIITI